MNNAKINFFRLLAPVLVLSVGNAAQADTTNVGFGPNALSHVTTGTEDTGAGYQSLYSDTSGAQNTALGCESLDETTSGTGNTAVGDMVMLFNTTGSGNTASGFAALYNNQSGTYNTSSGFQALGNTNGTDNTGTGANAAYLNTGSYNTAIGSSALFGARGGGQVNNGSFNTAVGYQALSIDSTGQYNIAVGYEAGSQYGAGSYNIDIGNTGFAGQSNEIQIGTAGKQYKTVVAGIYGTVVSGGMPVYISNGGQLGVMSSSAKFKMNIHSMGAVSDALMSLRPVTFQYKSDIDPNGTPQFGLIAEEVEKVSPDLVVRDDHKQIYSVRYEAVNAMMLNEVQKQHETIVAEEKHAQDQDKTIAEQQQLLRTLAARLDLLEQKHGAQ